MPKMLDRLQKVLRGEVPPPPIATLIGFTLAAIQPGQAVIEFETSGRHANPMGTLHGGVLCDIADAAMGMAYASTLVPKQEVAAGGSPISTSSSPPPRPPSRS